VLGNRQAGWYPRYIRSARYEQQRPCLTSSTLTDVYTCLAIVIAPVISARLVACCIGHGNAALVTWSGHWALTKGAKNGSCLLEHAIGLTAHHCASAPTRSTISAQYMPCHIDGAHMMLAPTQNQHLYKLSMLNIVLLPQQCVSASGGHMHRYRALESSHLRPRS
jgi:hypothetical protein